MAEVELPPVPNQAKLRREIDLVPTFDREDAIQEAWLAYLQGGDAINAVWAFNQREFRHRQRQTATPFDNADIMRRFTDRRQIAAGKIKARHGEAKGAA